MKCLSPEMLRVNAAEFCLQAAAASASKGGKPIVIPPPPAPVIIEAPPPKKVETADASTQASQPVAVSAPPKVEEEEDVSPVRDVRQTDDYKEAMAMQASRRKAHKENVALRMCAGRIVRNKAAFFREWRRKVEDNKRFVGNLFSSQYIILEGGNARGVQVVELAIHAE